MQETGNLPLAIPGLCNVANGGRAGFYEAVKIRVRNRLDTPLGPGIALGYAWRTPCRRRKALIPKEESDRNLR